MPAATGARLPNAGTSAADFLPARLTLPNVGRKPQVRQRMLGETMLPKVSLPSAKLASPAATAAALPAEEPLLPCCGFHGLRVMPANQRSRASVLRWCSREGR